MGPAEQAAAREDQTQQSGTALPIFDHDPASLRQHRQHRRNRYCSFWDPSKAGLIAVRAIAAGGTDDADGVFSARAHPDHSGPQPAFTRERDLDSKRSQERLRPPQSAGERPRIFCPCCVPRDVISSTFRAQKQKV
jgi:hypothetical protein